MTKKKGTAYVFLDTNIFLQFNDFDNIDWRGLLGYQQACLVVSPINLTELEGFKYDRASERRQKRSRMLTKKIAEIALSTEVGKDAQVPGRDGVTLRVLTVSPDMSKYPRLQPTEGDDKLIAAVLEFTEGNNTIPREDIVLITDDSGVLVKGRANAINVQTLTDDFRLPDEATIDQKKIARLERQLSEIKQSQPKLRLAFFQENAPSEELSVSIQIIAIPTSQELDQLWEQKQTSLIEKGNRRVTPKVSGQSNPSHQVADIISAAMKDIAFTAISQSEYDRYVREVKEYAEKYKRYLVKLHKWQEVAERYKCIDLAVLNEGTSPATGLVIQFIVPDGLDVRIRQLDDQPEKPGEPSLPMTTAEMMANMGRSWSAQSLLTSPHLFDRPASPIDPDRSGPSVRPHNSTLLEWKRSKGHHQLPLLLTPIWILFPASEGEQIYTFGYKIFADNIPLPVEGGLKITAVGTRGKISLI
jgi:PIN domain